MTNRRCGGTHRLQRRDAGGASGWPHAGQDRDEHTGDQWDQHSRRGDGQSCPRGDHL
ncbi:hypothetical protein [Ornithinimicrobium kibberense]|uniref:hypothetical protein n=1 Tax=Ornithinimicrobium kibberense TaxID=282060 RepID=UPI00361082BC